MNTINQQIQEIIRQQKSLQSALDRCVKELAEKEPSVSETKQQDLSKVISQADLNGLEIKDHFMAAFDDDFKNHYAFLLIALLKEVSIALSNDQYVLLRLLLQSMKLNHELSYYFEGNTAIDDQFLLDFKEKIEGKEVAQSLLADLMIIVRINSIFDQQALQTLFELMSFFEIEESEVKEIDAWVAYILGLSNYIKYNTVDIKDNLYIITNNMYEGLSSFMSDIVFFVGIKIFQISIGWVNKNAELIVFHANQEELESQVYAIKSQYFGYFYPTFRVNQELCGRQIKNEEIVIGTIAVLPQYLHFWYSFIDLEKVIKENK